MTSSVPSGSSASRPSEQRAYADWMTQLEQEVEGFGRATDAIADWDAPVPTCPDWTVADLVRHVGLVHEWVCRARGRTTPPERPTEAPAAASLAGWYRTQAAQMLEMFHEAGPDGAMWTLQGPGVAATWVRRQCHEVVIHRYDLAQASLGAPWDVPEWLALDGIAEVVDLVFPRQLILGRSAGLEQPVLLEATLDDGLPPEVFRLPGAEGASAARPEPEPAAVRIRGAAWELYLALWGRVPYPGVDPTLAAAPTAAHITS